MIKLTFSVLTFLGFVCLGARSSEAQVVTSYYAAPTAVAPLTYSAYSPAYSPGQFLAAPTVAPVVPAYTVTANRVSGAVYGAPVIGIVPVRQGLFGLRTVYVPVVAPTAFAVPTTTVVIPTAYPTVAAPYAAAPYAAARPVISSLPYGSAGYAPAQVAYPAATYAPNAVIQSGFRGTVPVSGYAPAPLQYTPAITAPGISFYPGAVMSMQ